MLGDKSINNVWRCHQFCSCRPIMSHKQMSFSEIYRLTWRGNLRPRPKKNKSLGLSLPNIMHSMEINQSWFYFFIFFPPISDPVQLQRVSNVNLQVCKVRENWLNRLASTPSISRRNYWWSNPFRLQRSWKGLFSSFFSGYFPLSWQRDSQGSQRSSLRKLWPQQQV